MVNQEKITLGLVWVTLAAGTFLRLYRLPEMVMFQGDQGRDAIVAKHLIIDGHLPLLGPVTSVGNMYLGPFYYYFMAPWLALTYPNPIGPAIAIAIVSILTLPLVFIWGRQMLGSNAAVIALVMFAFLDPLIYFSRFSWNPNLAPTVSLMIMWSLYKILHDKQAVYILLAGVMFSILTQLHYLALMDGLLIALITGYVIKTQKNGRRKFVLYSLISVAIYALSWLPLIVFDLTHHGIIHQGFVSFLTSPERHLQPLTQLQTTIQETEGRALQLLTQMFGLRNYSLERIFVYGSLIWLLYIWKKQLIQLKQEPGFLIASLGLVVTITGSAFYRGTVFDHYLLFAVPFAIYYWSTLLGKAWQVTRWGKIVVLILMGLFVGINTRQAVSFAPTAPSIAYFRMVTDTIKPQIKAGPYNLVLLAESKDYKGMNYRYFFETTPHPPESPDTYTKLKELIVIDEIHVQNPLEVNIYEMKAPGLSTLTNMYTLPNGPSVYVYE